MCCRALLLFGVGITLVVAPLTTTLMGSVPVANAGLGSAINNAVSRVGSAVAAGARCTSSSAACSMASWAAWRRAWIPSSDEVRAAVQPLNPPPPGTDPATAGAMDRASTDAFRLAMLIDVGAAGRGRRRQRAGLRKGPGAGRDAISRASRLIHPHVVPRYDAGNSVSVRQGPPNWPPTARLSSRKKGWSKTHALGATSAGVASWYVTPVHAPGDASRLPVHRVDVEVVRQRLVHEQRAAEPLAAGVARPMERAVQQARLAAHVLHHVDLARRGPADRADVRAQHPERGP